MNKYFLAVLVLSTGAIPADDPSLAFTKKKPNKAPRRRRGRVTGA